MTVQGYFWTTQDKSKLFIGWKDECVILGVQPEQEDKPTALVHFTEKEFSSFVCELVKYVLALPEVARAIPFYESCAASPERPHGIIGRSPIRKTRDGEYVLKLEGEYAFALGLYCRYHGLEVGDKIVWWEEDGQLFSAPLKSKANIIQDVEPRWKGRKVWHTEVKKVWFNES